MQGIMGKYTAKIISSDKQNIHTLPMSIFV